MHTQNKSPITHFVLSGICAAILAACGSSNGGGDSPKNLSVAPKNNINKDDAKKDNTNKNNTSKDNTDKGTTNKDNSNKINTDKGNADKNNANKDNKTNTNKETLLLNKGIQDKLTTLKLSDVIKTEQFNQTEVNTGFIANNLGATPLLETAKGPHDYPTSHILTSAYRKDKTKLLRPQTVILGGGSNALLY